MIVKESAVGPTKLEMSEWVVMFLLRPMSVVPCKVIYRGVGRAELWVRSKQLKIPPGRGSVWEGTRVEFFFFCWGGGVPGNLETPLATPLLYNRSGRASQMLYIK